MPPEFHSHAVFGFSESLNWSTLHFVKPIDDIRVCSACRAVARKTAFLACRHVLCEPCYEHWKSRGSYVCFLDGDLCPENEVHWMEFPEQKMMKNQVSCWNRDNGCEFITDVSSIAEHFHRDCAYHSACCPECSSNVLRRDIIAHIESQCVRHVLSGKSTTPPGEKISQDVECLRQDLRGLESAFRSASNEMESLQPKPEKFPNNRHVRDDLLLTTANDLNQASQAATQALRAAKHNGKRHIQRTDMKLFGASMFEKLDEIKMAAEERCRKSAANEPTAEHEELVAKLRALQKQVSHVTDQLDKLKSKADSENLTDESGATCGLLEVARSSVFVRVPPLLRGSISPVRTLRVFENALKQVIQVVWCFDIGHFLITDSSFELILGDTTAANGHTTCTAMFAIVKGHCKLLLVLVRRGGHFAHPQRDGVRLEVLSGSEENITFRTFNDDNVLRITERKPDAEGNIEEPLGWCCESELFPIRNLFDSRRVKHNKLTLRFTFSY